MVLLLWDIAMEANLIIIIKIIEPTLERSPPPSLPQKNSISIMYCKKKYCRIVNRWRQFRNQMKYGPDKNMGKHNEGRARICKSLRSPGIDSKELILPICVA
jgi:hypothetical protein